MRSERIKQPGHIAAHNRGQVIQIFLSDVCRSCAEELLNDSLRHVHAISVHHLLSGGQHALIHAQHLRPAMLIARLSVCQTHDVHGTVTDVRHHHRTHEIPKAIELFVVVHQRNHSGVALRKNAAIHQMNAVGYIVEDEMHVPAAQHIVPVVFPLAACPGGGQAHGKMHVRFSELIHAQFTGNRSQRQDIEILVGRLVRVERLMAFANAIPGTIQLQDVAVKKGPGGHRRQAGRVDRACGLHVAVASVHTDDHVVIILSHYVPLFLLFADVTSAAG